MPLECSLGGCPESTDLSRFSFSSVSVCLRLSAWALPVTGEGPPASPDSHLSGPRAPVERDSSRGHGQFPEDAEGSPQVMARPGLPCCRGDGAQPVLEQSSAGGTALAGHVGVEGTRWADGSRRPLLLPLGRGDSSLGRLRQAHFLDWDVLYGYRVWFY